MTGPRLSPPPAAEKLRFVGLSGAFFSSGKSHLTAPGRPKGNVGQTSANGGKWVPKDLFSKAFSDATAPGERTPNNLPHVRFFFAPPSIWTNRLTVADRQKRHSQATSQLTSGRKVTPRRDCVGRLALLLKAHHGSPLGSTDTNGGTKRGYFISPKHLSSGGSLGAASARGQLAAQKLHPVGVRGTAEQALLPRTPRNLPKTALR